jgi:hypothetical protein
MDQESINIFFFPRHPILDQVTMESKIEESNKIIEQLNNLAAKENSPNYMIPGAISSAIYKLEIYQILLKSEKRQNEENDKKI